MTSVLMSCFGVAMIRPTPGSVSTVRIEPAGGCTVWLFVLPDMGQFFKAFSVGAA